MFIDRVFKNSRCNIGLFIENNYKYPLNLLSLMEKSLCFDITNVTEYSNFLHHQIYDDKSFVSEDIPNIMPPSEFTWFEWKENDDKGKYKHGGCFIHRVHKAVLRAYILYFFGFMELVSNNIEVLPPTVFGSDYDGNPKGLFFEGDSLSEENKNITLNVVPFNVLFSLSLLHCKNVSKDYHVPSSKIQKSREKRNKPPLVKYYTLDIKPMTKILKKEGQIEKLGIKHALHVCRGHFKDYSNGHGLFGKFKGLYWWDNHIRGDISQGLIIKDYNVLPN